MIKEVSIKFISLFLIFALLFGCVPSEPEPNDPDLTPKMFELNEILKDSYIVQKDDSPLQSIVRSYQYRPLTLQPHQFNMIYISSLNVDEVVSYYKETFNAEAVIENNTTQLSFSDEEREISVNVVYFLFTMVTVTIESETSWTNNVLVNIEIPVEFEGSIVSMSSINAFLEEDMKVDIVIYIPVDSIDLTMEAYKNTNKDKEGFQEHPENKGMQWIENGMSIIITRALYSELLEEESLKDNEVDQEMIMIVYTSTPLE
jgi:hypothetical protein